MAIDRSRVRLRKIPDGTRINIYIGESQVEDLQWLANLRTNGNRSAMVQDLIAKAVAEEVRKGSATRKMASKLNARARK